MRIANLSASCAMLGCLLAIGQAQATTITTLSSDFESPTFTVGPVGGNPPYTPGQGGWGGYNGIIVDSQLLVARISDEQAHSGTQSLRTVADTRTLVKALDPSQGEYPSAGFFSINNAVDWWVQAWVRINPGGSALMTLVNGLGSCPLLQIASTGVPSVNGCISADNSQATLGAGAFDQWLALEMIHTTSMGQGVEFRITGPGISRTILLGNYSGPGSGSPQYIGLTGDAFWDDVRAGTGAAPAISLVPLPGAAWLLVSALGALAGPARFRRLLSRESLR
jgi:hypothetical protein